MTENCGSNWLFEFVALYCFSVWEHLFRAALALQSSPQGVVQHPSESLGGFTNLTYRRTENAC